MRGSVWNKWELHIHTPGTKLQDKFKDSAGKNHLNTNDELIWKEYCQMLNESGVKCFGITDYFSVDNYIKLRQNRRKWGLNEDIVLFPNIELRLTGLIAAKSDNKEHAHVNVHVIFPEDVEEAKLKKFLTALEVTAENGQSMNFYEDLNTLIVAQKILNLPSVETFKKALSKSLGDDYKEQCIIMIPNGDDGLSKKSGNGYRQNLTFMRKQVGIIQTTSSKDRAFHLGEDCKANYKKHYPCVGGSDAHSFERFQNYEREKTTWIKADTNFQGLKSILIEPGERVVIQESNPDVKLSSKVIDYIKLPKEEFGEQIIYFNSGMNTIVGGRSSGKSLLMSLLAKKTGNVDKVKRNDTSYEVLVEAKSADTEVYLADGKLSDGKTIIEFFYQDKLQEIAADVRKRNQFIKEIIGEQSLVNELEEMIQGKTKQLSDLNVELKKERQILRDLTAKLEKIQTSAEIENNILEIKEKLGGLNNESDFNNGDWERVNSRIQEIIALVRPLEQQIAKYRLLEEISFYTLNINLPVVEQAIVSKVNNKFQSSLDEINANVKIYIKQQINLLLNQKEKLEKEKEQLEKTETYVSYQKKLEAKPLLDEIQKQNSELSARRDIEQEVKASKERLNELITQIVKIMDFNSLLASEDILNRESVRLTMKVSLNKERIGEIFKETFKTGYKAYKSSAEGVFKEIVQWKEDAADIDFTTLAEDLKVTIKNILTLNSKDIYKASNDDFSFIAMLSELNFINRDYHIEFKGSDFSKMSEGKKAFVLLLLKLAIGEENCPLLIDQPEDDLDNRAIVKELVDYLKKQKKKRQVFVVTHNANILVASDSENVIIANEHDEDNPNPNEIKYYYKNGSLENDEIREAVCEILEGGPIAFEQRSNRYRFNSKLNNQVC